MKNSKGFDIKGQRKRLDLEDLNRNMKEISNNAQSLDQAWLQKNSTLRAFSLSKLINEQGRIFCLLHEKLRAGWKENLKNLSEHALLLGTSE